jgi:hypothetical protein
MRMKKQPRSKRKGRSTKRRARPRRPARPRQVYLAIRKLLDATSHIQARAAQVETALEALREQERANAVANLLLALRNSPEGDLLRPDPAAPGTAAGSTAQAITAALVEAFSIVPLRDIGERIALRDGHLPDTLELDRPLAHEHEACVAVEVVSVGWSYGSHPLLPPIVRPLFAATLPAGVADPKGTE